MTVAIYDLYAIKAATINDAKELVESLLSIQFEERDSSYHRGPYFMYGHMGEENFEISVNLDPYEDVPSEDDFPDHEILLYVNDTPRSGDLQAALTSNADIILLRHEDLK
jgi:hypothetical protein